MNRTRMIFAAALMLVSLAFAGAVCGDETTTVQQDRASDTGITVSGEGKVTAEPDMALITLGVSVLAPTVAEARDRAATALDAMITSMKGHGVDDNDIQTQGLSIYPEYDYSGNQQVLRGFRMQNTVTAKIRSIDDTSAIVDDAVTAGGDSVSIQSIGFTIDKPDDLRQQAREAAVRDARARAETLASAGGVDLGDPISISEGSSFEPPVLLRDGFAEDAAQTAPSTPIQPGELDVVVSVSVTFAIK
ncbi:MAG: SIMPL domain-containing protein [Dehalococcoidia bacterium]